MLKEFKKIIIYILLVLLFCSKTGLTQIAPPLESLANHIKKYEDEQVALYEYSNMLYDLYERGENEISAIPFLEFEKYIIKNNSDFSLGCLSLVKSSKAFYTDNNHEDALRLALDGIYFLKLSINTHTSQELLSIGFNWIGYLFQNVDAIDKAHAYYSKGLEVAIEKECHFSLSISYNNLSFLYSNYLDDVLLAQTYLEKAINISKEMGDDLTLSTLYTNLASLYLKNKEVDKARKNLDKSFLILHDLKDSIGLAHTYLEDSKLNLELKQFVEARKSLDKALFLSGEDCYWCTHIFMTSGLIAKGERKISEAKQHFLKGLGLANAQNDLSEMNKLLLELAKITSENNNTQKAVYYYSEAIKIKDTIDSQWKIGNLVKADARRKLKEIEYDKIVLEKTVNRQEKIIFLTIILLLLALITGVAIFSQKSKIQYFHQILVQKNRNLTQLIEESKLIKKKSSMKIPLTSKERLNEKIIEEMEEKKRFKDSDLTLISFAKTVNTNTSYLSKTINDTYQKSFSVYINEYRIREVLLFFEDEALRKYTFFALAQKAGFKSKSSFNKAFKKYTGVTPTVYFQNFKK